MSSIYENKEYCATCGGKCCQKSGCDYIAKDFESLKYDFLISKLEEGYISVVATLDIKVINKKIVASPFLYLRARGINRGIIDLFSLRTKCSALNEAGCQYDANERPSGGINLIPMPNPDECYPERNPEELVQTWAPYQNVLRRIVKRYAGKSADTLIREDFYQFFFDIFNQNYKDVSPYQIEEVKVSLPMLALIYPEEYEKAQKSSILVIQNRTLKP